MKCLITGGAGFIGSHLTDDLLNHGFEVRVLDNLDPQIHGDEQQKPGYLDERVEFVPGDVSNRELVEESLEDVDYVVHFAAKVGVGQSMYQIEHYTYVNDIGTAILLESIIENPVQKLVVASSMSLYGEGLYRSADGEMIHDAQRSVEQLKNRQWEPVDSRGRKLEPIPTPESKVPDISSIYALNKYNQERMCLITGRAYDIPTIALRFFNVYGTRQAISNPYTGVLAIFSGRLLNDQPPLIYEDGNQIRDFIAVEDIAAACRLALTSDIKNEVFNVGSGERFTIRNLAEKLAEVIGKSHIQPIITEKYRIGDIRHCFSDISRIEEMLGFRPKVTMDEGIKRLAQWLENCMAEPVRADPTRELEKRGLTI